MEQQQQQQIKTPVKRVNKIGFVKSTPKYLMKEYERRSIKNYGSLNLVVMIDETNQTVKNLGYYEEIVYKNNEYKIFHEFRSTRLLTIKNKKNEVGYQIGALFLKYDEGCYIYYGVGFRRKYVKAMNKLNESDIKKFVESIIKETGINTIYADKRKSSVQYSSKNPDKLQIKGKKTTSSIDRLFGFKQIINKMYRNGLIKNPEQLNEVYEEQLIKMNFREI
jgi:RNase H-fold protein (predicted Holliday junction resolvase)